MYINVNVIYHPRYFTSSNATHVCKVNSERKQWCLASPQLLWAGGLQNAYKTSLKITGIRTTQGFTDQSSIDHVKSKHEAFLFLNKSIGFCQRICVCFSYFSVLIIRDIYMKTGSLFLRVHLFLLFLPHLKTLSSII